MSEPFSYDHEIVVGSNTYKLRLARDKNGKAMYSVGEGGAVDTPVIQFVQQDWSGGHGEGDYMGGPRYATGQHIETSERGRAYLGPRIYPSGQSPSVLTLINKAFQDDGGAFTDQTTAGQNPTVNDMALTPAVPVANDAYYFGAVDKFDALYLNVGTPGVGTWTITWEYWNNSTWADATLTGTGSDFKTAGLCTFLLNAVVGLTDWAQTSVNGVTRYWLRARVSAFTAITTQPLGTQAWTGLLGTFHVGQAFALDAAPTRFIWFPAAGSLFCATTNSIYEYNDSSTYWQQRVVMGATITDLCIHNTLMYVAQGASTFYQYTADGDTYTATDLTDGYANGFVVAPNPAGTADFLWKFKTPNEVSNTSDGRTSGTGGVQWSTAAYVGDTTSNITNLIVAGDLLLVGRADGMYNYDTAGGIHSLMAELQTRRSANNFKYKANYHSRTYVSLDTRIAEIGPGLSIDYMGPLQDLLKVDIAGTCIGMDADDDWLYVAMDEGTNNVIYKGSNRGGRWAFHPFVFLSTNACTTIYLAQHANADRRLWFGYGTLAGRAKCYDNIGAQGTNYDVQSSGNFTTGYWDAGFPTWSKIIHFLYTETANCAAGRTVTVKYKKDTETSYTALTAAITGNGIQQTYCSSALSCKKVSFEVDLATNNATSPVLSYFEVRGILIPEVNRFYDVVYSVEGEPTQKVSTLRGNLRTARTNTSLIKLADYRFDEKTSDTSYHWVMLAPGYPQEVESAEAQGRQPQLGIKVRWIEVDFTIS